MDLSLEPPLDDNREVFGNTSSQRCHPTDKLDAVQVSPLPPEPGYTHGDGWEASRTRVDDYLRLLGVSVAEIRSCLVLQIMARATSNLQQQPHRFLHELAMEELQRRLTAWVEDVLALTSHDRHVPDAVEARIALLLADVARRWPEHVLCPGPWPKDLISAMHKASLHAVPEPRLTPTVPNALAFSNTTASTRPEANPSPETAPAKPMATPLTGLP